MSLALLLLYIVGLGALWWFIGRKNRERNKKLQEQMNALKAGDHIVTIGGLHGVVHYIDTDAQTVEIDCDGVYLTFERRAIHHVVPTVGDSGLAVADGGIVFLMNKQEELLEQFRPWFSYKIIEFITQGYESISSYDIATYFVMYRWKKQKPENLFEQIYQLNQLTINDYFDYESIMAQTSTEMTLDTIDLSDLLD